LPLNLTRTFQRARASLLSQAWVLIGLIAIADWKVDDRVPLGWLYLLPVSMLASRLGRAGLVTVAILCTALAEAFDGFKWQWQSGLSREVLYFSAFAGIGLFVHQTLLGRRAAIAHMNAAAEHMLALEAEVQARREAEEQLEILIESTPVAVFTADAGGTVLLANAAAGRLFALAPGELPGRSIGEFIPPLLEIPALRDRTQPSFRTVMQCRGHRANGEIFQADVWFSTYGTSTGPRLAALVLDTSEDLRNREESSLDQLLAGSRILVGAVSHEVRNVCAAIKIVYENLARAETFASMRNGAQPGTLLQPGGNGARGHASKDFEALGTLVVALERIASMELSQAANQLSYIDLHSLLEEVLIVIAPALREQEVALVWEVAPSLPMVWADRQSLMQVFLNLVKNSERAMETSPERTLTFSACCHSETSCLRVRIRVRDTGGGVQHPELLFKPFQQQASATGLGLYLSRALMRSFSGELRYEAPAVDASSAPTVKTGACFVVELNAAPDVLPARSPEVSPGATAAAEQPTEASV
jgi:PAS domain S-box-containing protein